MTTPLEQSLDRALDTLDKHGKTPRRAGRRFSLAPWTLAAALFVGYGLASRLVPKVWGELLPGGWAQARTFTGVRWFVWGLAVEAVDHFATAASVLVGIAVLGFVLSRQWRATRPLVWLMAIAAIALDAGILIVTLHAAYEATAQKAGLMQ